MEYAAQQLLQQILQTTPGTSEVSLANLGIMALEPLLPQLRQLRNLSVLKLQNNNMQGLPEDLSDFTNLVYLDMSNNPIGGLSHVQQGLLSLPNLKHLYINFPYDMDEDEVIIALQSLESFNGTPLNAEEDVLGPVHRQDTMGIPIGGIPRGQLPPPPGTLLTETTQHHVVRKQSPQALNSPTAQGAPHPHHVQQHPNGPGGIPAIPIPPRSPHSAGPLVTGGMPPTHWRHADMEAVQKLYAAANAVAGRTTDANEFERYTSNVVSHLQRMLEEEQDIYARQEEILRAKQLMYEFCFEEIARSAFSYDPTLSNVLDTLYRTYADLLECYKQLVTDLREDRDTKLATMRTDMQHATSEIQDLMTQLTYHQQEQHNDHSHPHKGNEDWDLEKNGLVEEIGWLRSDNERLQSRLKQSELARQKLLGHLKEKERELDEARHLSQYQPPLPGTTPGGPSPPPPHQRPPSSQNPHVGFPDDLSDDSDGQQQYAQPPHPHDYPPPGYIPHDMMYDSGPSPSLNNMGVRDGNTPHTNSSSAGLLPHSDPGSAGMHPQHGSQQAPYSDTWITDTQNVQRPAPTRELSLRKLKEIIEDIYASKSKFDIKCTESALPRETPEQHLYTYLNQKYGLKGLILDKAQAIVAAIRKYSHEDNDVAVFGKILRNELDDEFRFVQRQLKETVRDLLKAYFRGKYSMKTDDEITRLVKRRTGGYVQEAEWVDIIKYMYNSEDAVTIIVKMKEIIKQQQEAALEEQRRTGRGGPSTNPQKQNQIKYQDFLKVLLDFQLSGHEKFLAKFVKLFRQFDSDKNGIVNETEFRGLLRAIEPNKTDDEINQLLELIDPHNNQLITFSECVTFLSSELVSLMSERAVKTE